MRRYVVVWVAALTAMLMLALGACSGEDNGKPEPERESTTSSESDSPTPSAPPDPFTVAEFCTQVRTATTKDGEARALALLEILQQGLPDELDAKDRRGLQVLLDLAPELDSVRGAVRAYRDLGGDQRKDLRSLAGFMVTECGRDFVADLMPDLPDLPSFDGLRGAFG